MQQELELFKPKNNQLLNHIEIETLESVFSVTNLESPKEKPFQKGGSTMGWKYANSFYSGRYENYMFHISQPEASRSSCSRLSPYIAWGNISMRQVLQRTQEEKESGKTKRKKK